MRKAVVMVVFDLVMIGMNVATMTRSATRQDLLYFLTGLCIACFFTIILLYHGSCLYFDITRPGWREQTK